MVRSAKRQPARPLLLAALFPGLLMLLPSCDTKSPGSPSDDLPPLPIASRGYEVGIAGLVSRNHPDSSDQDFLDFLDGLPLMGERSRS